MNAETAERLSKLRIELVSETEQHYVFARDNCIALVERAGQDFGSIGSTGIMSERGLAFLVYRSGQALLAAKGGEVPATELQVTAVRQFSEDLRTALL